MSIEIPRKSRVADVCGKRDLKLLRVPTVFKLTSVCSARFFEYRCVRMPQYAVDENMTVVEVDVEGELAPVFIMPTPLRINHTYSMVSQLPSTQLPLKCQSQMLTLDFGDHYV